MLEDLKRTGGLGQNPPKPPEPPPEPPRRRRGRAKSHDAVFAPRVEPIRPKRDVPPLAKYLRLPNGAVPHAGDGRSWETEVRNGRLPALMAADAIPLGLAAPRVLQRPEAPPAAAPTRPSPRRPPLPEVLPELRDRAIATGVTQCEWSERIARLRAQKNALEMRCGSLSARHVFE